MKEMVSHLVPLNLGGTTFLSRPSRPDHSPVFKDRSGVFCTLPASGVRSLPGLSFTLNHISTALRRLARLREIIAD